MDNPLEESGYLEHKPASPELVNILYERGFIKSQAKDYALDQIAPKPTWPYQCSVFLQMIGIALLTAGILLAIFYQWPHLSTRYQLIVLMMGILCGIYGAFVFSQHQGFSQVLLLFAAALIAFLTFKLTLLHRPLWVLAAFGVFGIAILFAVVYRALPKRWFKR